MVGETFDLDSIRFEVTQADERRIRRLRIRYPVGDSGPPEPLQGRVDSR